MTTETASGPSREPELAGQTVVVIGGTAGVGLGKFSDELTGPIDQVLVTGPGPYWTPLGRVDGPSSPRRRIHGRSP